MRLFVGIALSSEAAEILGRVRERFAPVSGELRWMGPENWHVTLQFLGESDAGQATCVTERLAEVRAELVPVSIGNPGFFERAGVFHAGVLLTPELLALQQKVTAVTSRCGFVPEERAYQPHITLARARGRGGRSALAPLQNALGKARFTLAAEFTAAEFLLYESFPRPDGSRYEVRARFALTGG